MSSGVHPETEGRHARFLPEAVGFIIRVSIHIITSFLLFLLLMSSGIFSSMHILLFRGIAIAGLVSALQVLVMLVLGSRSIVTVHEALASVAIAASVNLNFLVLVPVTLDRSLSIFVLGYMAELPDGASEDQLNNALKNVYLDQYGAVRRRLAEQMELGNVVEHNGRFLLSSRGANFVRYSKLIAPYLSIDKKFLVPVSQANVSAPR